MSMLSGYLPVPVPVPRACVGCFLFKDASNIHQKFMIRDTEAFDVMKQNSDKVRRICAGGGNH